MSNDSRNITPLAVAALATPPFAAGLIAAATGLPVDRTVSMLEQAVEDGLLQVNDPVGRTYVFVSDSSRDAHIRSVPPAARMRLHGKLAEALSTATSWAPEKCDQIVNHYVQAAPAGYAVEAVQAAQRAAAEHRRRRQYLEAAEQLKKVRGLAELGSVDLDLLLEVALQEVEDRWRAWDPAGAADAGEQAWSLAQSVGDAVLRGRAALAVAGPPEYGPLETALLDRLSDALQNTPEAHAALRARLRARFASGKWLQADPEEFRPEAQAALAEARACGDPEAICWALRAEQLSLTDPDLLDRRLRAADELVRAAESVDDQEALFFGRGWRYIALVAKGRISEAEQELRWYRREAAASRHAFHKYFSRRWTAGLFLLRGLLSEARSAAEEAMGYPGVSGYGDQRYDEALQRFFIEREQGSTETYLPLLQDGVDVFQLTQFKTVLGLGHLYAGRRTQAERLLHDLTARGLSDLARDVDWILGVACLAELAVNLHDLDAAPVLYEALLPYERRLAIDDSGFAPVGTVGRLLGELSLVTGDEARCALHLELAEELALEVGAALELGYIDLECARLLRRKGDVDNSDLRLSRAMAKANDLGSQRLLNKISDLAGGGRHSAAKPPSSLTPSELRVAKLVAQGFSNPEVAAELFISRYTVETHLKKIYAKLGISSRARLAWALTEATTTRSSDRHGSSQ